MGKNPEKTAPGTTSSLQVYMFITMSLESQLTPVSRKTLSTSMKAKTVRPEPMSKTGLSGRSAKGQGNQCRSAGEGAKAPGANFEKIASLWERQHNKAGIDRIKGVMRSAAI
jgi:hypothetical protein